MIIDWPHSDVILAASGKIRDNVEALGAEQVDSSVFCVDQVFIKSLKRLCETGRVKVDINVILSRFNF